MPCAAASEPSTTRPLIALRGVGFTYGDGHRVLAAIDLDIVRGDLFGLLGPNGAGKTTLISLLSGLLPVREGSIQSLGEPLAAARARKPALISLVPQDYAFYPMLTTAENLRFFAGVQGLGGAAARTAIERAIAFSRLEQTLRKQAGQLSGGLKRRLNLAIGLLNDPDVLLLDEPTAGVDPQSRHFLLESIAALRGQGKTILYTSHYMDEIETLCERVAIIDGGRILVCGTLDDVLRNANQQARTEVSFRLAGPLPDAVVAAWQPLYSLETAGHHAYRLTLASTAEFPALLRDLDTAGCTVLTASCGQRNLEEVFMHLTRRSLRD